MAVTHPLAVDGVVVVVDEKLPLVQRWMATANATRPRAPGLPRLRRKDEIIMSKVLPCYVAMDAAVGSVG